jgi:uncharacterized protein YbjT (DUF2867 family)
MRLQLMAAPAAPAKVNVLIAGASGLVGSELLPLLCAHPDIARVVAVSRRPLVYDHPRLANRIVRFDALEQALTGTHADVAYCCLGTTQRAAGSEEAFRKVDHDHVLAFARAAHAAGVQRFVFNSSVDANPRSPNLYLRVKGETEEALTGLGFAALDLVQPSLLLGWRRELRPLELAAMAFLPLVSPLLMGNAERYRAVSAATVAAAMAALTRSQRKGVTRYTHRGIAQLARPARRS